MTLEQFAQLTSIQIGDQIKHWEEGNDKQGFDLFALDFADRVIFPFKAGSEAEKWSDRFLAIAGSLGMDMIREMVLGYMKTMLAFQPFRYLESKLQDDWDEGDS